MKYLICILGMASLIFFILRPSLKTQLEQDLLTKMVSDQHYKSQVFDAMEKSIDTMNANNDKMKIKQENIYQHINHEDKLHVRILDVMINYWNRNETGSLEFDLGAITEDDIQTTFYSMKDLFSRLPADDYGHEKVALLKVMFGLEYEGSDENVRRLAIDQLSSLSKVSSPYKEEIATIAYYEYLQRTNSYDEAYAQTMLLIKSEENETVVSDIINQFNKKFPNDIIEN